MSSFVLKKTRIGELKRQLTFSKLVKQVILPNKYSWTYPRGFHETAVVSSPSPDAKILQLTQLKDI
jgi:hypothetical protein